MPWSIPLRKWQREAVMAWGRTQPKDYLAVATPGGGKTLFSGAVATGAIEGGLVDQLVICVPTTLLRTQWATDMASIGIQVDSRYRTGERIARDLQGVVVTYAQIMDDPQAFRRLVERRRTLLISDEIHHAGEQSSWGISLLQAGEPATHRLHLSGTPFKTDESRVAFLEYDSQGYVKADFVYGYADALRDGVVRPVVTYPQGAEVTWKTADGVTRQATFEERDLSKKHAAQRLRAVLEHEGWVAEVIARAHSVLRGLRKREPDAAALAVGMTAAHARFIANVLREVVGVDPAVVLSEDPEADQVLARFRSGNEPWLVAVRKVAEGVDVKRLRVEAYLTNARTELLFRQLTGRIVRVRDRVEPAYLFLPADPTLVQFCQMLEAEVRGYGEDGALPKTDSHGGGAAAVPRESSLEVLDAAHQDGEVIMTRVRTVDPFEAPRPVLERGEREVVQVAHQKHELRNQLSKLASAVSHKFDIPRQDIYGWWKYQTRRSVEQLSADELEQRVDAMRDWLHNGRCPVSRRARAQ